MVMSQATLFSTLSSGLRSILDVPLPPAEASVGLVALEPRMAELDQSLERQARDVAELRLRSAVACWRWYQVTVMGGAGCWAEWEERMSRLERGLRRVELAQE